MMEKLPDSLWPQPEPSGVWGFLAVFDGLFFLSYLLGLAVLLWVSWDRLFNEPYAQADDRTEKVLRLMPPGNLRGTLTVLRAYAVYSLLVGGLYSLIALAGSFLWDLGAALRLGEVAGLSLEKPPVELDDPAWPLAVSLAFVGFSKSIPRLQSVELTFRRWAHRSIGIPPFIRQRTREVLAVELFDENEALRHDSHAEEIARLRVHAADLLGEERAEGLSTALGRIALMHRLLSDHREPWPSAHLKHRFDPMMREITTDCRDVFEQVLGVGVLLSAPGVEEGTEAWVREQNERRRLLENLAERIETVHWDLCGLVAVFIENEPVPPEGANAVLRGFVDRVHEIEEDTAGTADYVLTIVFGCLGLAFFGSWLGVEAGLDSTIGQASNLMTAGANTVKVALVVLPPLLVGIAIRDGKLRVHRWRDWSRSGNGTYPVGQYVNVFATAFLVCLPLVMLFYAVLFVSVAGDAGKAREEFATVLPAMVMLAMVGGLQGALGAFAISETDRSSVWRALRIPLVHGALVILLMAAIYAVLAGRIGFAPLALISASLFDILRFALVSVVATYLAAQARLTEEPEESENHPHFRPQPRSSKLEGAA